MPLKTIAAEFAAHAEPLLIKSLLRTPLQVAGDQEIVYRDRVRYTYRDLETRIAKLANALTGFGVGHGTTVSILDWDSHRYLECYFSVPMLGAVLHTVNIRLAPEQIEYTIGHANAEVLIVNREFLAVLEPMLGRLSAVRAVLVIDEDAPPGTRPARFHGEYETLLSQASGTFEFEDFDENAVATTFYTTGTTGLPKGVCFTHRQLVVHTLATLGALASAPDGQSLRQGDVYMPITPMFHVHAWGIPYVATVLGVKQVYPGRYEPRALIELRRREGVTYSHCVPTILQMLLDSAAECGADLSGWKMIIGGAALARGLLERALGQGMDVFAAYGMSETCPFLTLTRVPQGLQGKDALAARGKTGLPVPLVELRVVDQEMRDVPRDGSTPGEIVVRAPWLTQSYAGDAEATRSLWRGRYLHTQDIGCMDAQGYVQITDRLKDVIKTGGEWVSSLSVEDIISRHSGVAEVAVVGAASEKWGERPVAFVVAHATADASGMPEAIRRHVASYAAKGLISKFAVPEQVMLVKALDRTSVGKIDKKAMRSRCAALP
jgi:fatty-acyl-CoA synthase